MPKKKTPPKKVVKKQVKARPVKKTTKVASKSRTLSFWIGVITIIIMALFVFKYAQTKNYKSAADTHSGYMLPQQ